MSTTVESATVLDVTETLKDDIRLENLNVPSIKGQDQYSFKP
jgi:hypothetical protein